MPLKNVYMETSILQHIITNAGNLIKPQFFRSGRVLDVRAWPASTIIEVDLHLPAIDMRQWNKVPFIKIRIGETNILEYIPFGWDAETYTCSLLIDTIPNGRGDLWVHNLCAGDTIQYLEVESRQLPPDPCNLIVALGDGSSLAHLLALQQLVMPATRFDGAVLMDNAQNAQLFNAYYRMPITVHSKQPELEKWFVDQNYCIEHTSFYLTGSANTVASLRKLLKSLGYNI